MGTTHIYLIAWLVVFPILLVIMVFINRAICRKYARWKRERDRLKILERYEEETRAIRESLGIDKHD